MKILFFLFLFNASFHCFSQEIEPEFAVYFGNDFKNDSVTIFVNGIPIVQNIKLKPTMIDPKNLVIEQNRSGILVRPFYEKNQFFKRIQLKDSVLNLAIAMNNAWQIFKFDLKKGKHLYAEYKFIRIGWSGFRILTITQSNLAPLYI
jgi:hypothetical protein